MSELNKSVEEEGLYSEEERQKKSEKLLKENNEKMSQKKEFGRRDEDAYFEGKHIYMNVDLPSGGVFDEKGMHDTVTLREMTSEFDEILSMAARDESVEQEDLKSILVGCVTHFGDYEKDMKVHSKINELLHTDYLYLFMKLRQLSVGDEFRFRSQCVNEQCRSVNDYEVKLSELAYDMPCEKTEEARYRVDSYERLPDVSWDIHWHFMTVGELDSFRKSLSDTSAGKKFANMKTGSQTRTDFGMLAASMIPRVDKIVEPDGTEYKFNHTAPHVDKEGVLGISDALDYIKDIPWKIRQEFVNETLTEKEPGVDDTVYLRCSSCGDDVVKSIRVFDGNFFMPSR